jgi:hypothetical protein
VYQAKVYGVSEGDGAIALTKAQYKGGPNALHEVRWTPSTGFYLVGGDGWFCKSWFGDSNFETKARDAVAVTMERHFPSRLAKSQSPFSVLVTLEDAPFTPCLNASYARDHCDFESWAPIFAFGSTPRNLTALPTMRRAPLITLVDCYIDRIGENAVTMRALGQTFNETPSCGFLNYQPDGVKYVDMAKCKALTGDPACKPYDRGLFTLSAVNNASAYEWDALKSKVFWRGNDFWFLSASYPEGRVSSEWFVNNLVQAATEEERARLIRTYLSYAGAGSIGPRTRAVLLSLLKPDLIDAKFFDWGNFTGKQANRLENGRVLGIDASERATEEVMAKFRYLIDIGGGGGTTFTGTIAKLSMPGVLLHHMTPTVDSYHHYLKPFVHYVPVATDLSNLEARVQWLNDNQDEAKAISDAATEWTRWFRKVSTLLEYHNETLVQPLRRIVDPFGQYYVA